MNGTGLAQPGAHRYTLLAETTRTTHQNIGVVDPPRARRIGESVKEQQRKRRGRHDLFRLMTMMICRRTTWAAGWEARVRAEQARQAGGRHKQATDRACPLRRSSCVAQPMRRVAHGCGWLGVGGKGGGSLVAEGSRQRGVGCQGRRKRYGDGREWRQNGRVGWPLRIAVFTYIRQRAVPSAVPLVSMLT